MPDRIQKRPKRFCAPPIRAPVISGCEWMRAIERSKRTGYLLLPAAVVHHDVRLAAAVVVHDYLWGSALVLLHDHLRWPASVLLLYNNRRSG